jgi:hypothetical protein
MQRTEVKATVDQRVDPARPPAAESPGAREESCCAAPSRRLGLRPWLIGGAVLLALVLYAGWDWLVAAGVATFIVALAPCLAMCALGLCMGRSKSKGEMPLEDIRKTYETNSAEPPKRS